ncbi:MAG TPA: hypothetical protein VFU22_01110 [Roseiflexaceae bacterium]|nr:hypothetical protein [Roseiflexaceae bacterium]
MSPALLTINILTFGFALWLGLYLMARNPAKPLLRYAGLGLVAYALSLVAEMLSAYALGLTTIAMLLLAQQFLVLLPAMFWSGALLQLLPEDLPLRRPLVSWWSRGLLPLATLGYAFAAGVGLLLDSRSGAGPIYLVVALLALVPLLLSLALVVRYRHAIRPQRTLGLLLAATLMFGLGLALMIGPLGLLPREWALLGIGVDLVLLDIAIAGFDAFDEGEMLLADITRSFVAALLAALLFGSQVALAILVGVGVSFAMLMLLLATVAAAITLTIFANPVQSALDQLVFAGSPRLRRARDDARAAASALPRLNAELDLADLDVAEFARLTRRALSHYGDLPRLATNPLTRLPQIEQRLARRGTPIETLEPAIELKALLAESVARLKPRGQDGFGSSDEWRHYNALFFPYIAGLKPYSRRAIHQRLDPAAQQALDWIQAQVPERTLYNWQTAAAKLVAQDLREQMYELLQSGRYAVPDVRRGT